MTRALITAAALALSTALAASQDVSLKVPGAELHGTLLTPDGVQNPPVALIIAGSGPTDRDGNSPLGVTVGSYRKLAEALQSAGIATLRYDKRGIAASAVPNLDESKLRFTDYVDDAGAWLKWLSDQKSFGKLAVIGHSEGSLIGLTLLQQPPVPVSAFVSLAGPGENLGATIRRQIHANPANPPALVEESDRILDSLQKGQTVAQVSPLLMSLFRPSVQPYLISQLNLDPTALIANLKLPILIAQGERDIQVSVADAQALKKAQPKAQLLLVPDMNHVLVDAPADPQGNAATYARSDLPLDPALVKGVTDFLKASLK